MYSVSLEDSGSVNKSIKVVSSASTGESSRPSNRSEPSCSGSASDDCAKYSESYRGASDLVMNVEA